MNKRKILGTVCAGLQLLPIFKRFDANFVFSQEMEVRLTNPRVQNDWTTSSANEQGWVRWNKDNTIITIKGSGRIETEGYLCNYPTFNFELIKSEVTDYTKLLNEYDKVVLATGTISPAVLGEKYRSDIFRPVLGDILEVSLALEYPPSHLEGLFIIPLANSRYILGSTYIHEFTETEPTKERAEFLIKDKPPFEERILEVLLVACYNPPLFRSFLFVI